MRSDQMPTKANLKDHDEEKCPSIESVIRARLEQQNTALMAQVEEIREISQREDLDEIDIDILITESLAKAPQQSLESLKAKIEEETIKRCAEISIKNTNTQGEYDVGADIAKYITSMPRKYAKV